jgi:hypothetical protein
MEVDPWENQVLAYPGQHSQVRTPDILRDVLDMALERRDRKAELRVAAILRGTAISRTSGELTARSRVWRRQKRAGGWGRRKRLDRPNRPALGRRSPGHA